jgi:hypothetical protein
VVAERELSFGTSAGSGGRWKTVSPIPLSLKTLTQQNLFDLQLELLGVYFQAGDVTIPAAGTAAMRSSLGKAVGNSIHNSIGPRWHTANAPPGVRPQAQATTLAPDLGKVPMVERRGVDGVERFILDCDDCLTRVGYPAEYSLSLSFS